VRWGGGSWRRVVRVIGSVAAGLVLVIVNPYVAVLPSAPVTGPVLATAMLGATSVTATVAVSVAVAGVPSSSRPATVTTLTTVPGSEERAVGKEQGTGWPWVRSKGPVVAWAPHAALPAAVRSPS